jgi:phosphotransferase system  glucose/maltose/N-acetylglucosamine-specific IIC component
MEKASRVMYSIANIFNWIIAIFAIAGIVLSILDMTNVLPEDVAANAQLGVGTLVGCIFIFLVAFITILMVRRAKAQGSSKAWDVLFIVLGVLAGNLFYVLGGIFGLVARR